MTELKLHPWEPEETVGTIWHRTITGLARVPEYPDESITLAEMQTRLGTLFRGMGGQHGVRIVETPQDVVSHRRSFLRRLGHAEEKAPRASFDGETLELPACIACFESRSLNEALYVWLAIYTAHDDAPPPSDSDPLRGDLLALAHAARTTRRTLAACPGMAGLYRTLCAATLAMRPAHALPSQEAAVESIIRFWLGDGDAPQDALACAYRTAALQGAEILKELSASRDYMTFEPVPLWPHRRQAASLATDDRNTRDDGTGNASSEDRERRRAARRKSDQANRRDSLILHRFETILSWADFLNINRRVVDDDEANARKAADDAKEMAVTDIDQSPATKLAFDLDLAPHDIDREALSGEALYAEWDYRSAAYHEAHARVLFSDAEAVEKDAIPPKSPQFSRRLRAVRRQFEALRPKRAIIPRQSDGDDLDIDEVIRSQVDLTVSGEGSDRVYRRSANQQRDLSVAILIDTSRSTESVVHESPVIEIARESLLALGYGLTATGDDHAIYSFSSLRRDRVFVTCVKAFGEKMGSAVEARIAALRPGFYTRLGAAIRHVSRELGQVHSSRRLMLVITDGKPNDLDHYEGRYGIEDSRKAILEARRQGHAVFGIAIDRKAERYIPYLFGQNGFAIVSEPHRLLNALPAIYRHLVT